MISKKKLQVFVSSTYKDLMEERQAAVEAILMAGHIPAGMELFAAGDESQMNAIKRWIDESDIFMLILGGRYGSIEQKSKKSYIHLEYEYATKKHKPLFAVVVDQDYLAKEYVLAKINKKDGRVFADFIEQENSNELNGFRSLVCSKLVRFWRDPRDIKLAIMETLSQFNDRDDLIGWMPATENVNSGAIAEQLAILAKENAQLKDQLDKSKNENMLLKEQLEELSQPRYSGYTFVEMSEELTKSEVDENTFFKNVDMQAIAHIFNNKKFSLLHAFWVLSGWLQRSDGLVENDNLSKILSVLIRLDLVEDYSKDGVLHFKMSQIGKDYLQRLRRELNLRDAEKYILP